MHIILTGFSQDMGFRVFAFECVGEDKVRTGYKVRADLLLVRKYGILMQELPLLCRRILERRQDGDQQQMYTFTEADMCIQADLRAAKTAPQKRRSPRSEHRENAGAF